MPSPLDNILTDDLKGQIDNVIDQLTQREQAVIRMRYGLMDDNSDRTLDEIALRLNISKERVRQIEATAIKKLKHPNVGRNLKTYMES